MTKNDAAQPREVWIHFYPDGQEEVFECDPKHLRTLHVMESFGMQTTRTWNQKATGDPIPPPGGGWELFDSKDPAFCVWRRLVRAL